MGKWVLQGLTVITFGHPHEYILLDGRGKSSVQMKESLTRLQRKEEFRV